MSPEPTTTTTSTSTEAQSSEAEPYQPSLAEQMTTQPERMRELVETLRWPERPTCHDGREMALRYGQHCWEHYGRRDRADPYDYYFRQCSYCGSIHPQDLARALLAPESKVYLGGADWKYGWPHKFYVEQVPNPIAGTRCVMSWSSRGERQPDGTYKMRRKNTYGPAPAYLTTKWYNEHLLDLAELPETFDFMAALLARRARIHFFLRDGKLGYSAPRWGYQEGDERTRAEHARSLRQIEAAMLRDLGVAPALIEEFVAGTRTMEDIDRILSEQAGISPVDATNATSTPAPESASESES